MAVAVRLGRYPELNLASERQRPHFSVLLLLWKLLWTTRTATMWLSRGITGALLPTLLLLLVASRAKAFFPTWTQDMPNKQAMPLTELPVEIHVVNASSTAITLDRDLVLLSYERAAADVNETTDAAVNESLLLSQLPIDTDVQSALVAQQGNGTTGPTVLIQNGTRLVLVRTAGCNTTAKARKLGATLASTIQSAAASANSVPSSSCTIDLSTVNLTTVEEWAELAASLWQGFYKDTRFRGPDATPPPCRHVLTVMVPEMSLQEATQGMKQGRILAEAVCLARDVVNAPHNVLNSLSLAQTATALAKQYRRTLSCQILNVDECEALGMGAFLGVARGSETTARFIHLTYRPRSAKARKGAKVLGIVGKGLLFDTGGVYRILNVVVASVLDSLSWQLKLGETLSFCCLNRLQYQGGHVHDKHEI